MKKLIIILTALVTAICCNATALTEQADTAYANQDYAAAVQLYHKAIANDGISPQIYYNLANSYYRLGKPGRAVLYYNRALQLDPSMQDARDNLAFVNTRILDKPEDDSTFLGNLHEGILAKMKPDAWAWTAFFLFLAVLGCVAIYIFSSNVPLRKCGFFGGFIMIALFIYALTAASQTASAPFDRSRAVIIVPTANLSTAPGATSGQNAKIIPLHEGTVVEITDSTTVPGDARSPKWYDVKINNSTRAWARSADLERI
ncbi:MAG: tetratricopeptide repeat protein [Clostridium sp.]|nr:tetratricopeptide repeat protein [Clostridium sp.]